MAHKNRQPLPEFGGENEYAKLLEEVDNINDMTYAKSRKKRAELIKKQLKNVKVICGAINREGKVCTKVPHTKEDGSSNGRCLEHGGNTNGPVTPEGRRKALSKLNPQAHMVFGLYSRFVMSEEEMDFYVGMMNYYIEALQLDLGNILLLDRAIRNFIINQRREIALNEEDSLAESQSYNDYDTKFLRYMQALGVDRKFNESRDNSSNTQAIDIAVLLGQASGVPPVSPTELAQGSPRKVLEGELVERDDGGDSVE